MIERERVLILGGSGMVGSQFPFGIKPRHSELDITNADALSRYIAENQPNAIIHLAGIIDVKKAESDPAETERVNVGGSRTVARVAAAAGIPLVYFSSCMVFNGQKATPYVESDAPTPLTVYGKTKYEGELAVLEESKQSLVIRTGWLFGGFERDVKFIHRFYDMLKRGDAIRATNDRYGSPTYVPDLINETIRLLEVGETGTFHVVNSGVASYLEVAEALKAMTGSKSEVIGATQKEIDPQGGDRGAMEGLISERGILLRPYTDALQTYVTELDKGAIGGSFV